MRAHECTLVALDAVLCHPFRHVDGYTAFLILRRGDRERPIRTGPFVRTVKVGLPDTYAMHRYRRPHDYPKWLRMNMEIFVDGKLRTQSGMMGTDDKARLLVVDGLENAKELKLRARMNKFPGIGVHTVWGSPTMYK